MILRSLSKQEVEAEPFRVWNAFVDLLTMEDYDDLSPEQRPARLVYQYESEVQNGGHLQYFENRHGASLSTTVKALGVARCNLPAAGSSRGGRAMVESFTRTIEVNRPYLPGIRALCRNYGAGGNVPAADRRAAEALPAIHRFSER